MKNFYAYIIKNNDGLILDPSFIVGEVKPVRLVEDTVAFSDRNYYMSLLHDSVEDAEVTMTWYLRNCELVDETPDKLHVEKVQITVVCR